MSEDKLLARHIFCAMTSRREFVRDAATIASFIAAPKLLRRSGADHDLILRGGTVFDGRGAPGIEADVAITGNRIAAISRRIPDKGKVEIDVRGQAVAPGFV